jgi:hypothetical protein
MVFQPGVSGNPKGYSGPRLRRHRAIFEEIKKLGHKDALMTLSTIQNDDNNETSIRVAAAAALAPFAHPKMAALPTPRYIEHPLTLPEFSTIEEAERVLARIPTLFAKGELDSQSSTELTQMLQAWIQAKQSSEFEQRLMLVERTLELTPATMTAVVGGLPRLPGTDVIMPSATNGHALPAPDDKPPLTGGSEPDP